MAQQIKDHNGKNVTHGRETVNGVRLHYYTAGKGEAIVLLHGVPKTSYYWRNVLPKLSSEYTVVVPDLRGFGDSGRTLDGYDMPNMAEDIAQLMTVLGHETFYLVGEDWGAAVAYALTAQYPERVKKLVYQEMLLPGFGLEEWSHLTTENVKTNHWIWHINFYNVRDFPELLISGREKAYFSHFIKHECYDPTAISDEAIDEYVRCYSAPGGLRSMFEVYRATFKDAEFFQEAAKTKLKMPVLALGSKYFINDENTREMKLVAENVEEVILPWGHQLAEECPEELSQVLLEFIKKESNIVISKA